MEHRTPWHAETARLKAGGPAYVRTPAHPEPRLLVHVIRHGIPICTTVDDLREGDVRQRITAWDREESEACERSTPGCSIDHTTEREARMDEGCEPW
jgi:hypothetical protein